MQTLDNVTGDFTNSLVLALCTFSFARSLVSLTLLLNFLRLLQQLGRRLVKRTLAHHTHRVHPWLRSLHQASVLLFNLRSISSLLCALSWAHRVPDRVEINRLLCDMLEGLLLSWLLELHLFELACHHLLRLHVSELLFHHSHSLGIASLCSVLIALCCLACSGVSHDH